MLNFWRILFKISIFHLLLFGGCQSAAKKEAASKIEMNKPVNVTVDNNSSEEEEQETVSGDTFELSQNVTYVATDGGGARAFAHIGIFKGLDRAGLNGLENKKIQPTLAAIVAEGMSALVAALYIDSSSINEFEWKILKLKNEVFGPQFSVQKRSAKLEESLSGLLKNKNVEDFNTSIYFGYKDSFNRFVLIPRTYSLKEQILIAVSDGQFLNFESLKSKIRTQKNEPSVVQFAKNINKGILFTVDTQEGSYEELKMFSDFYLKLSMSNSGGSSFERMNETAYKGERESKAIIKKLIETMSVAK